MKHYVIVGNGAAGTNAADQLRRLDAEAKICMITEEAFPFYSRIRLIDYIAGDIPKEALVTISNCVWAFESLRSIRFPSGF